jgi:hypothetical protein
VVLGDDLVELFLGVLGIGGKLGGDVAQDCDLLWRVNQGCHMSSEVELCLRKVLQGDPMKEQKPSGEVTVSEKEYLKQLIEKAWEDLNDLAKAEEEAGFEDEMITMDKTRAQGYAEGLSTAFRYVFKEEFNA